MPRPKKELKEEVIVEEKIEPVEEKSKTSPWEGKTIGFKPIMSITKATVNKREYNLVTDLSGTTFLLSDEELDKVK